MAFSAAGVDSAFPAVLLAVLLKPHPWRREECTTNLHTPNITATFIFTTVPANTTIISTDPGVQIFNTDTGFRASFLGVVSATSTAAGVQHMGSVG